MSGDLGNDIQVEPEFDAPISTGVTDKSYTACQTLFVGGSGVAMRDFIAIQTAGFTLTTSFSLSRWLSSDESNTL
jgi:hypothetical protein